MESQPVAYDTRYGWRREWAVHVTVARQVVSPDEITIVTNQSARYLAYLCSLPERAGYLRLADVFAPSTPTVAAGTSRTFNST